MAETSLACFFKLPIVGIAINIKIKIMAITISSSISVKPLDDADWRALRWLRAYIDELSMDFP